eukprot:10218778-Ditylum_brightwellii.AAC.2
MVVSGTYGVSLEPNFDCGSGPPDMIVGINAGVFMNYDKYSGMNYASLGRGKTRASLYANPICQPCAMP